MTFFDLNSKSPEGHTDRTPDIIWRDSSTGQYAIWYGGVNADRVLKSCHPARQRLDNSLRLRLQR